MPVPSKLVLAVRRGIYIDELLQQKNDISGTPADQYPLQDTLYRTVALTNSSGAIIEAYDTDAYGNTLIFTAAGTGGDWWTDDATQGDEPTCDFIYTGRRYDSESEIYFYRARYYVPELGRFASRDPLQDDHGYCYAGHRPITAMDPLGLQEVDNEEDEFKRRALRALGPGNMPEVAPPRTCTLTWTDDTGRFQRRAELIRIAGDKVVLRIKKKDTDVLISKLSEQDKSLVEAMRNLPPNIRFDFSGVAAANQDKYQRQIIADLAELQKYDVSIEVLKSIADVGIPRKEGKTTLDPLNSSPLTIQVQFSGDQFCTSTARRKGVPRDDVVIHYDPTDEIGDLVVKGSRKRPSYVGLLKELVIANRALRGISGTNIEEERVSRAVENKLRNLLHLPPARFP